MSNDLLAALSVVAIGTAVFFLARWSRNRHEERYGVSTKKDKARFITTLGLTQTLLLAIMYVRPQLAFIIIGIILFPAFCGIRIGKPGLARDMQQSAIICSIIALFAGVVLHSA
jgi:hypothetical protein